MKELLKDGDINDEVKAMFYITAIIKLALTTSEELTSACGDKVETYSVARVCHLNLLLLHPLVALLS
jgi:hypothetical protein